MIRFRFGGEDFVHGYFGNIRFGLGENRYVPTEELANEAMNQFERPEFEYR